MQVYIHMPDNSIATRIELGHIEVDFLTMWSVIPVMAYNEMGDKLYTWKFDHKLEAFPIPNETEQWLIVMPLIEDFQRKNNL